MQISKETLQTALENVESHWEAKNTQMGQTEKARYKRCIEELKEYLTNPDRDRTAKMDPKLSTFPGVEPRHNQ